MWISSEKKLENVCETSRLFKLQQVFIDSEQIKFVFIFETEMLKRCAALCFLLYISDGEIIWQKLEYISDLGLLPDNQIYANIYFGV